MTTRPWPANTIAVPLTLAAVSAWDGLGYLLGPRSWSASPGLVAFDRWPGGIRTYGLVLLLAALLTAGGVAGRSLHVVRLGLAALVSVWAAHSLSVLWSWHLVGVTAWGGPTKGAGFALLAAMILRRTPDYRRV